VNKVILIGNLGSDAELKFTPGGQAVANFRVCTTEKWMKDGQKQERSEWHSCVWWGKGAEAVAKYLEKGKKISVEGSLQTREWTDKEGGKRYKTEIRVDNVELLSSKGDGRQQSHGRTDDGRTYDNATGEVQDDDIPF